MSLSLMTIMGNQRPTRHEKYVIGECIKIIRYNKYPEDEVEARLKEMHNKTLNNMIKNLGKILARPIREDRIVICEPEKLTGHYRCVDIPMPTCKDIMNDILKKEEMSSVVGTKDTLMDKYRKVKVAFNEFKDIVINFQMVSTDDEALLKLTLDNLFTEIRTATGIIKERMNGIYMDWFYMGSAIDNLLYLEMEKRETRRNDNFKKRNKQL